MILVIIVVLSTVLVQFTEKGLTEIAAEGHYVERDRLRITAFSALEATLAVLADVAAIEGGLTSPAQGWGDPLAVAGFDPGESLKIDVGFVDESGKLPLNSLDEGTLYLLFTEMGFNTVDSLKLTNCLLDWIDEDDEPRIDGAESDLYAAAEWPHGASNQPVRHLDELAVVEGFRTLFFDESGRPNEAFRTFADTVSVHADGTLNANSVSALALRAYAGFGEPQTAALAAYRAGADGIPGTADDRHFARPEEIAGVFGELPEGARLGVETLALRVRITVTQADARYSLEAVVEPTQGGGSRRNVSNHELQQQTPATGASTAASSAASIPYPFLFLELTEDVGHNASIAAPTDESAPADPSAPFPSSSQRG